MTERLRKNVLTFAEMLAWILGFIACYLLAPYIVQYAIRLLLMIGFGWDFSGTVGMLTIRVVVYAVMIALLSGLLWLRVRRNLHFGDFALARLALQWRDIGLAMAGAVVYLLGTMSLLYVATAFLGVDAGQRQDLGIETRLFGWELMAAFMVLVVFTPILEEVLFRGILYGKLRTIAKRLPWWLPAIIVSILFSLAHQWQWNIALDVFVLSMVACALREVTGSIWGGIVLHMIKNMIAFIVTFAFIGGIGV